MSTIKAIPKEKLQRLRRDLKGHITLLAKRAGVAPVTMYKVLNGQYENMDLISSAIEYRDELRRNRDAILAKL